MNNPNPKNLSLQQIIDDAHELTQLLKKQFHKDKVYLVGFSWGSIIGLKLIEKYPDDYIAYFGVTQVINLNESIKVSREWIMQQARIKNDTADLNLLARIDKSDTSVCKRPLDCFLAQFALLSKYGGAIYTKASEQEIEKAETQQYADYKKYDWYKAFKYSAYRLENDLFNTDLSYIKEVKVPVYLFMGRHDWNLPTSISERFLKNLTAPKKEIVWFENSGHEPLEEEADKFNSALIERVK
jgi:pimeloyl-ACP methyl ester carboxylesterase